MMREADDAAVLAAFSASVRLIRDAEVLAEQSEWSRPVGLVQPQSRCGSAALDHNVAANATESKTL